MTLSKSQILHGMDPSRPETIQALIDFNRRTFDGFSMVEDDKTDGKAADGDKPAGDGQSDDGKTPDDDTSLGEGGRRALQAERDARQALERQIAELKASQIDPKKLAEALGIKPEDQKESGADMVATLQKQIGDMQHETRLFRIVAKHQITDDDDIELLRSISGEAAMEKLAARLAKASSGDGGSEGDGKTNTRVKPDKSQGNSGSESRPSSVAEVMEARRAAREAKK